MSTMQNSNLIAAAVGATIGVLSVATVFIYNKVMERQQHTVMNRNIDRVNRKVAELQAELEELRAQQANLQKNKKRRLMKRQVLSTENTYTGTEDIDMDTFSTAGTDIGDEEFYDCSDDEGGNGDLENGTTAGSVTLDSELLLFDKESEDRSLDTVLYQKLKILLKENPKDVEYVWRFARACYHCSVQADHSEDKKDFISEGCDACEEILHVRDGNLYKWYAILVGLKSKYLPTKGRIENGYRFKEYVEKALEINPEDGLLHHLMGRFKYEVSELSWIAKKVASTLFAEVPKATYEDAIPFFEKAEKLSQKPHYENKLFLSKSYIAIGKYQEAVTWLNQINESFADTDEEREIKNEARNLLEKYSEYCT